jgi:hypothetical protein
MPISKCQIDNKPGYKCGKQGKCYEYTPGDEESVKEAKKRAISQGVAVGDLEALMTQVKVVTGRYDFSSELAGEKTSFDFDGVLSTKAGQDLWRRTGGEKWVITARNGNIENMVGVWEITDALRIPRSKVIATGSNRLKIEKIKELHITRHYDDNADVITRLPNIGRQI